MRKKTVLCEVAFWKKFSECYPSLMPFPDERAIENLKCWMELYSFLFRSDVHFDCSDKQFIELAEADERLRYLWKKSAGGECGIDFPRRALILLILRDHRFRSFFRRVTGTLMLAVSES